jgi:putative oxidoreductase
MSLSSALSDKQLISQVSSGGRGGLLRRVLATPATWSGPLARVALVAVMFPHGAQKVLGWYGGHGFAGTMGFFTEQMGLPAALAALVIGIEFVAPLLLLVGLATRVAALGIGAVMIGAIATVHGSVGFFMNWSGAQAGEGYEYHLLALGLAAVLVVQGAGRASLDRLLARG